MKAKTVIKIEGLQKQFNMVDVLQDVSLEIAAGCIVGLVGSNGAGKSTLIRHMVGLYLPNEGTCETFGHDAAKLGPQELARIGYVHQEGRLIDWMTVEQMVRYVASYYPSWNTDLENSYLAEFKLDQNAIVGDLSPGQRQKLAILLAIGHEPDLLLLDEPAAALDPLARQHFLDLLLKIIQNPARTILVSSHILSDVEKIIDHIIILDQGKVCRDVDLDELQQEFVKIRVTSVRNSLPDALPFQEIISCEKSDNQAVAILRKLPGQELNQVAQEMDSIIDVLPLTLDELYGLVLSSRVEEAMP